ncbi:hypothetical protein FB45DRAFT_676824, partial [Roridomyces roridus]
GIFGKVKVYFGVVEAQGRGSLHLHILIWLAHGLSPLDIQERCKDPDFLQKAFRWYEDVFCQDLPEETVSYSPEEHEYKGQPVMSRPTRISDNDLALDISQEVRDIMENTAQIHSHGDTCFKYLPKTLRNRKDNDKDCRFQLPRETVEATHVDEDGVIVLKCNHGSVNAFNKIVVLLQRCNMDSKPVGSGTVAMAMFQYMGNYTIKSAMDSAFVFSALCASIKSIADKPPKNIDGEADFEETSRLLLVKSVNQLVGKRELSAQQVVTSLVGWPSKYTNRSYPVFYWTKM